MQYAKKFKWGFVFNYNVRITDSHQEFGISADGKRLLNDLIFKGKRHLEREVFRNEIL